MNVMDILPTYKPSGLKTHRSSSEPHDRGFVEWLEKKLGYPLFLFHRLDVGTSGILLVAKTSEAAAQGTLLFQSKRISKTYLLITKKQASSTDNLEERVVSSLISKKRGQWVSETHSKPNSETKFTFLKSFGSYQLWQAQPFTGKTHQIRLHAQSLGLSILGDKLYGGAPFFRLCLHAYKIEDQENNHCWQAEPPPFFECLEWLLDPQLCALLGAVDLREQLLRWKYLQGETYRLVHAESPSLRIDRFGDQLWIYDYHHESLSMDSESLVDSFFQNYQSKPSWIREMKNRGEQPNHSQLKPKNNPCARWVICENNITYELRADQGLSPGLFLDQRENRLWVQQQSQGLRVLNLFSYTCGFSLNAAVGGASEVVSVDVSSVFLDWGKHNFQLNGLDASKYEFWSADSMDFLKRTAKRNRKFDLIICDPPSFGRSQKKIFNIEKDLSKMVSMIFDLLAPRGKLFLSTNFEKWTMVQFKKVAVQSLPTKSFRELEPPIGSLDFIEEQTSILKTLLFERCEDHN